MSVRPAIAGNGAASSSGTIVQASRFSASTTVIGYSPSEPYRLAFVVAAILAAAGAFTLFRPTYTWMGLRGEEQAVNAGTYKTLDV
jgi:hypothetical protein